MPTIEEQLQALADRIAALEAKSNDAGDSSFDKDAVDALLKLIRRR